MIAPLFRDELPYRLVHRYDPTARAIANRHYSRLKHGTPTAAAFVGPGWPMILLGVHGDWLFVWRRSIFRLDGQTGVECSLFRNETRRPHLLGSELILIAEEAWRRSHGPTRFYTYVDPTAIRPKADPGYCFLKAGWQRDGESKSGLLRFAKEVSHV